jgi:hypothetical protein
VTERDKAEICRLHGRYGSRSVAVRLGVSERRVRAIWEDEGLGTGCLRRAWTSREDAYLRDHAGEQSVPRLARELRRSEGGVRWRLARLQLDVEELRTDLTATQIAEVIGRDITFVLSRIRRREIAARQQDGAWRIWPSALREWIRSDPGIVQWAKIGTWAAYLVSLLSEEA